MPPTTDFTIVMMTRVLAGTFLFVSFASAEVLRFDMGGSGSPVQARYRAVTPATAYTSTRRFGWVKAPERAFDTTRAEYRRFGTVYPRAASTEPADDMTIDGVFSRRDMVFRVDVPDGRYWVLATVGDLSAPHFKNAVSANGRLVDNFADAYTHQERGSLRRGVRSVSGGLHRTRFTVDVADGRIDLRFHESRDRPSVRVEMGIGTAPGRGRGGAVGGGTPLGFRGNAVVGLEIYPYEEPPFGVAGGKLASKVRGTGPFIAAMNAGKYDQAARLARTAPAIANAPLVRAAALLWLGGRPEFRGEVYRPFVKEAYEILVRLRTENPDSPVVRDLHLSARLFHIAMLLRVQDMAGAGVDMRSSEMNWVAESMLRQLTKGDPLHFNARYLTTGDKQYVIDTHKALSHLVAERKFEMVTSEVCMTDRMALGFGVEQSPLGPMTGDVRGWGGALPSCAVTWRGIDRHFVALVLPGASRKGLRVLVYNFRDKPLDVGAHLWRLDVGGEYELSMGPDQNADDKIDQVTERRRFSHAHRGDAVALTVPSRKTMLFEIREVRAAGAGHRTYAVPDLALSAEDIVATARGIDVTVHNIGSRDAGRFEVALYQGPSADGTLIGARKVLKLAAPNDLEPKTVTVSFACDAKALDSKTVTAVVDGADALYELTEVNNTISVTVRAPDR